MHTLLHQICNLSEEHNNFFLFPREPFGLIVHALYFLPNDVVSIRRYIESFEVAT